MSPEAYAKVQEEMRKEKAEAWDEGWDAGAEYTGASAWGFGADAADAMRENARSENPYRELIKKYRVWQSIMDETFVLAFTVTEQHAAQWAENNPNAIVMEASW